MYIRYSGKEREISKILQFGAIMRERVCELALAFLLAIIIAPFQRLVYQLTRELEGPRRRGVSYFRRPEKRIPVCPGRGGSVYVRMHSCPVVTDERFYRTSRCNREACVILLSIPFSLVEPHQTLHVEIFIFQDSL